MNSITPDRNQTLAIMLSHGTYDQQCQACKILGLPLPNENGFASKGFTWEQHVTIGQELHRINSTLRKLHHDLEIAYGKGSDLPATTATLIDQLDILKKKLGSQLFRLNLNLPEIAYGKGSDSLPPTP